MAIDTTINEALLQDLYTMYAQMESDIEKTIAKQALKGTKSTETEASLKDVQQHIKEINTLLNNKTELAKQKVSKEILKAYKEGINSVEKDTGEKITAMKNIDIPMNMQMLVLSANNLLTNATLPVLRTTEDAYRKVVAASVGGVIGGNDTRIDATKKILNGFAAGGVTSFVDKSGRNWNLASYAEMAARTATAQAAIEGHMQRNRELGYDLVKVSSISTTCPICAQWQGVVLSISGSTPGYLTVDAARAAGLFHPNCKHTLVTFIPELDGVGQTELNVVKSTDRSQVRNKLIEQQRSNERALRYWKRRKDLSIDAVDKSFADNKIKQWNAKQKDFCEKNNLRRLPYREGNISGNAAIQNKAEVGTHLKPYQQPLSWKQLENLSTIELNNAYEEHVGPLAGAPSGKIAMQKAIHDAQAGTSVYDKPSNVQPKAAEAVTHAAHEPKKTAVMVAKEVQQQAADKQYAEVINNHQLKIKNVQSAHDAKQYVKDSALQLDAAKQIAAVSKDPKDKAKVKAYEQVYNEAKLKDSVKISDEVKDVVKRYTTGGYKSINEQADSYLSGTPREKAFSKSGSTLFDAINSSTEEFDTLYRIETSSGFVVKNGKVISSPLKEGAQITWGLRSTSKSDKFIGKAAAGKDKNLQFVGEDDFNTKVVYRLRNETGLDVSKISPYKYQQEVIVSGNFEVVTTGTVSDVGGEKVIIVDIKRRR